MEKPKSLNKRVCPMDEHERFAKFYDIIPEIFRSYIANFGWTIGLLSIAIGWILNSESSRTFIHTSKSFVYISLLLTFLIIGLLHTVTCWNFYQRSQKKITQLTTDYKDLYPLPFQDYEISQQIFLINLLISWSLIGVLIAMILATKFPN